MYSNKNKIKSIKNNLNCQQADYPLLILVSLLISLSVVFSYSLSIYTVEYYGYNQFHFFIRQTMVAVVAIGIMWTFSLIHPDKLVGKVGMTLFLLFFFLMALMPALPSSMVTASGGANRWIRLPGFSLSPVEFFKIGFIYFFILVFSQKSYGST